MAIYFPITITIITAKLAELFFKHVIYRFSISKNIILNKGSLFTSAF